MESGDKIKFLSKSSVGTGMQGGAGVASFNSDTMKKIMF
jgi:hypothetical protein